MPVPAPQPVDFVAADFYVHFLQLQKIGNGADFILRREDDGCLADRRRKTEFFPFAETLAEPEPAVAHDARKGNGLIEGNFRGPLRNGIIAFDAFVQANVNRVHGVHHRGGASHEEIRQSRRGAGGDHRARDSFPGSACRSEAARP